MANEIVRLKRNGVVLTTVADASGHFAFQLSASGWPQGETRQFEGTAEDAARGMIESPAALVSLTAAPPNPLWTDLFDRADGPAGNGWVPGAGLGFVIAGGALAVTMAGGGYRVSSNPATGALPADVGFRVTIPHAMRERSLFGLAVRVQPQQDGSSLGVQFFMAGSTWFAGEGDLHAIWDLGNDPVMHPVTVTGGYPASWSANQDHTLEVKVSGTRASLWVDGQEYGYCTLTSAGAAGGQVALVGDAAANGGWTINDARVFPA